MNESENISQFAISGAGCASCVKKIETAAQAINGVSGASMNFAERTLNVAGDIDPLRVTQAISAIGYGAELLENQTADSILNKQDQQSHLEQQNHRNRAMLTLGLGIPLLIWGLAGGSMQIRDSSDQLGWGVVALLSLAILVKSASHIYRDGWRAVRNGSANMNTLLALGTGSAWLFSTTLVVAPNFFPENARFVYFEACLLIIGFTSLGSALESRARGKSNQAVRRLVALQQKQAHKLTDSGEIETPAALLKVGDRIRIKAGEIIPIDARVCEGQSWVDESAINGEPMPIEKRLGDDLVGGTTNQMGTVIAEVSKLSSASLLAKMIELVRQAQSSKAPIGQLADNIASYFVPAVMLIAISAASIWFIWGPAPQLSHAIAVLITVLIIACPCALGLATPTALIVGIGKAAEYGVLFRRGEALQSASQVDIVLFDKTGTLTNGKPQLVDYQSLAPDYTPDSLLAIAASLEAGSEHPLAHAIISAATHLSPVDITDFAVSAGHGVSGRYDNSTWRLGSTKWLTSELKNHPASTALNSYRDAGHSLLILARDDTPIAVFSVSDTLKESAAPCIEKLHHLGIKTGIVSGDNRECAQNFADALGIEEVFADLLPHEKAQVIERYQQQGLRVAMVGDGINDAPALALADVGIAMGTGTAIAMESADITLLGGSLDNLTSAIAISRATLRNIKQNLWGAFVYNSLGIPVAAGVLYPLSGTLLHPAFAGAAMALSSLTVVTNANRLRWFKPKK